MCEWLYRERERDKVYAQEYFFPVKEVKMSEKIRRKKRASSSAKLGYFREF